MQRHASLNTRDELRLSGVEVGVLGRHAELVIAGVSRGVAGLSVTGCIYKYQEDGVGWAEIREVL